MIPTRTHWTNGYSIRKLILFLCFHGRRRNEKLLGLNRDYYCFSFRVLWFWISNSSCNNYSVVILDNLCGVFAIMHRSYVYICLVTLSITGVVDRRYGHAESGTPLPNLHQHSTKVAFTTYYVIRNSGEIL